MWRGFPGVDATISPGEIGTRRGHHFAIATSQAARVSGTCSAAFLVEVIGCTLGVSGRRKDSAVVILENLQPSCDVGGVFLYSGDLRRPGIGFFRFSASKHGTLAPSNWPRCCLQVRAVLLSVGERLSSLFVAIGVF